MNGTESPAAAAAEERRGRGGVDVFCFATARVGSAPHIYVRPRVERRGLNPTSQIVAPPVKDSPFLTGKAEEEEYARASSLLKLQ